ncbi:hypothetical protein SAMN05428947_103177 [Mucilaginibacter sp. OK283]|nr:hypothetical protein SAMN05428947_103177 [Mucilaginibacter sp. OK283]
MKINDVGMQKIYYNLFTGLFLIVTISSCKLSGDVMPTKSKDTTAALTGTDPGTGSNGEVPIGAVGTISYQVDSSAVVTYNSNTAFVVFLPGDPGVSLLYPNGATQIAMLNPNDLNTSFTLIFTGITPGTYDIFAASINTPTLQLTAQATGTVKATILTHSSNTKGTVQGTFSGDELDGSFNTHHVKGSFNLKQ